MGAVSIYDVFLARFADARDADGQSGHRRGGVATHNVDVPLVAGIVQTGIEQFEVFHIEAFAQGDADGQLSGLAVHGEYIADVHHRRFETEAPHVGVCEVEMHAFHQHVGSDEHFRVGVVNHGAVVAHAFQ